ncbi:MAG TPA: hypothetical protein PLT86_08380 [Candidatus Latescibacteria bacterium]|nr:hypothetical protein [Candidatus Latescibacterota bacterium]
MKFLPAFRRFLVVVLLLSPATGYSWGYKAHQMITAAAIDILPADMQVVLAPYRAALVAQSHAPDVWRHDPDERPRHYVDLELGDRSGYPFPNFPRDYATALRRLGPDSLKKMGALPWHVDAYFRRTVSSLADPNDSTLVFLSALGHYVADAYMPMHTTVNYDGQLSGNRGVHLRFEWWMIDQNATAIWMKPGLPARITDPLENTWQIVMASYTDVDTILRADTAVRQSFRPPIPGPRGERSADPPYDQELWNRIGWLAQFRMNLAASAVAGFWYEAWLRAGKPSLQGLSALPPPPMD